MMNAAVYRQFGGPIRVERVPRPQCPADGVLVQVKATGVCRSDWHGWKGHDDDIHQHGLPFVPGHEYSGAIVELGRELMKKKKDSINNNTLHVGDAVVVPFILSCGQCPYCHGGRPTVCTRQRQPGFTEWGSFAEYVAVPTALRNVVRLSRRGESTAPLINFVQAAALGCRFTTAYRAIVEQGRLGELLLQQSQSQQSQPGDGSSTIYVAIFGAGGLGLSCIMIADAVQKSLLKQQRQHSTTSTTTTTNPLEIIAIDVSPAALRKAQQLGATHTILVDRQATDQDQEQQRCQKAVFDYTNDQGAHLTVDAAGFALTCQNAVYTTRRAGRMIQVGLPIDTAAPPPLVPVGRVAAWELELVGSHGFAATALQQGRGQGNDNATTITAPSVHLMDLLEQGVLDPAQLVERQVNLHEGARALQEDFENGKSPLGMTMITDFGNSNDNNHNDSNDVSDNSSTLLQGRSKL